MQFGPFEHYSKYLMQFPEKCYLFPVWQETAIPYTKADISKHSIPNMTFCFNISMFTCILHTFLYELSVL
jgi:hypothetical protein